MGPSNRDPRRLEVDDDRADAFGACAAGESTPDQARTRLVAARDVVLVRVQPEAIAVLRQAGAHVADRAAGLGLADADAKEPVAAGGERQPAVLQRVRAEMFDGARRTVEDELGEDGTGHVGPRELFEHDRGLDVAEPGASPFLADRDA